MNSFKTKQHTIFSVWLGAFGLAIVLALGTTGCKGNQPAPIVSGDNGSDPAADNLAPVSGQPAQVLGSSSSYAPQQQSESYAAGQQQPAPVVQGYNNSGNDSDQNYSYNAPPSDESNQQYDYAQQAPPPLPEYDQPPAPDPNYIWTPGYWAYGSGGYYWVPGVWVAPPYYGALWTPPYWGYYGGRYAYHHGYWGPHVGFYGGVNYGFGYIGIGFFGGYWRGHDFYYNRDVTNVGHVTNVYSHTVVYNNVTYGARPNNRVSYNGGRGGVDVRPRPAEVVAMREPHAAPLTEQVQLRQSAAQNRQQLYSANNGRPAQAAAERPLANVHAIAQPPREVQQVQQRQPQGQPRTQPEQHQQPEQRQQEHQQLAAPAEHPVQRPEAPVMTQRPQAAPNVQHAQPHPAETRPAPEARPAPQQARPVPEARPAPQQSHPAPQASRPAPEARPAPQARPAPGPEAHPAPHAEPSHEAPHPEGDHPHR